MENIGWQHCVLFVAKLCTFLLQNTGRKEKPIDCSMRTLYRRFKEKVFDEKTLPMKGKCSDPQKLE